MARVLAVVFGVIVVACLHASPLRAAPPTDEVRACVEASTQAQTARDEGRLLAARESLLVCAREGCPQIVQHSCGQWLHELDPRIPSVIVRVDEPGQTDVEDAEVAIDGAPITLDGRPVPLDPGKHTIQVRASGWQPVERTFLAAERESARLFVVRLEQRVLLPEPELPPTPSAPPAPVAPPVLPQAHFAVPAGGWVLAGVGVAGLVGFAALGTRAKNDLHHLQKTCAPDCRDAQRDAGERIALAADISLGIGIGALAGAGVWTLVDWLRHREPRERRSVTFTPSPRGAMLTGRY